MGARRSGAQRAALPWGSEVGCDRANWGSCVGDLVFVGSHPLGRSPEGVNDLIGNVYELTSDRIEVYLPGGDYTAFDPEPPCDPTHPARDTDRFVSIGGGAWVRGVRATWPAALRSAALAARSRARVSRSGSLRA